jgi:DNA-binding CsgD family transcriptional regulator
VLHEALAATLAGRGSLVLVGGEAGIGKTALAEAILAEATKQGALVLVGRAYDLSETPPYGPWREAFERAPGGDGLPALPNALLASEREGEALASQEAIIRRVVAYLGALVARRPLVLLLEDLHWADPASLDLLRVVGRGIADLPLLLLASYRTEEVARDHPLAARLPTLVREARPGRLDLRPLGREAIGALVTGRYALDGQERERLVGYLAGRSDGNALFLNELLRTLEGEGLLCREADRWIVAALDATPVPPLLRQVIDGRVARLGDETLELLRAAAVVGQVIPLSVWAATSGVATADLIALAERAIEARLLVVVPDGRSVHFVHALIREVIYEGLGALRRSDWHRRAAEALLATHTPDPDAVAHHLWQAGDPRAAGWLAAAGVRARSVAARFPAAERFARAATLLAGDNAHLRERGWLYHLAARTMYFTDAVRGLGHLDDADVLARLIGDRELAAHNELLRGMVLCHQPRLREGMAALERGVTEALALPGDSGRDGGQVALARLAAWLPAKPPIPPTPADAPPAALAQRGTLANWYGWLGDYRRARATGEANHAALADHPTWRENPSWGLAHALAALGQPTEAGRQYARARAACYEGNDPYALLYIIFAELQHLTLPYHADDPPERARLVAAEAPALAQLTETALGTPYPAQLDLPVALLEGRWAEAQRLAEAGCAAATVGHAQSAGAASGVLARWRGEPATAWTRVRERHPAGPEVAPGDCFFVPGLALLALAAELALDAGDPATAADWIAAHGRWLEWSGALLWQADHQILRARHAWANGDVAAARERADRALELATAPRQPLALLAARRLRGQLAIAAGAHDEAANHLAAALALADACAAPYERALTLLALAELRHDEGGGDEAGGILAEARAILAPLGARPALARADALAARLDVGPSDASPPAGRPDGLSRREAEVLGLLAAGRSNRDIAQALHLSPRTVQRHIANAYLKIGAHNKADATAYALRHGLS